MEWTAMLVLGVYHGINPGMGWLFAVALGMQQSSARGVLRALPPLALGHAGAVGVMVVVAGLAGLVLPVGALRSTVGSILIMLGVHRLWRQRHPRFGGMQVGFRDLTVWSFIMASAHGAGLMVLPFVLGLPADGAAASGHAAHVVSAAPNAAWTNAAAVGIHTLAYLSSTALAAWVVSGGWVCGCSHCLGSIWTGCGPGRS